MVFIKSFKNQTWLFPPSIEELIPEDHVCYLVESFIESLDFSVFEIKYDGAGHPGYHPRILLKLLLMGMLDKMRSSRKLARNTRENVVYISTSLHNLLPDGAFTHSFWRLTFLVSYYPIGVIMQFHRLAEQLEM